MNDREGLAALYTALGRRGPQQQERSLILLCSSVQERRVRYMFHKYYNE